MSKSKRKRGDNPVVDLRERLSRVEARLDGMDGVLEDIKEKVRSLDNRLWWLLGGIILSIVLALAKLAT